MISIHAPPRGATEGWRNLRNRRPYFNSRPSARGDLHHRRQLCRGGISIHAPPRGATGTKIKPPTERENFNSRPSARGDAMKEQHFSRINISIHAPPRGATSAALFEQHRQIFQFTPLREGRRTRNRRSRLQRYFNSRPSARGDMALATCLAGSGHISIHAPPRGATQKVRRSS
mgnify:CR=1 FL=1